MSRGGRLAAVVAAGGLLLVALDLSRPPSAQWTGGTAVAVIGVYQRTLSPLLGKAGFRCRFVPTCSRYAAAVIETHGVLGGSWRAGWRLLRCGPWTPAGTEDPPEPPAGGPGSSDRQAWPHTRKRPAGVLSLLFQ